MGGINLEISKQFFYCELNGQNNLFLNTVELMNKENFIKKNDFYPHSEEEFKEILKNINLNLSNDEICQKIVEKMSLRCKDFFEENFKKLWVGLVETDEKYNVRAHQQFYDDSLLITYHRDFSNFIVLTCQLLSSKLIKHLLPLSEEAHSILNIYRNNCFLELENRCFNPFGQQFLEKKGYLEIRKRHNELLSFIYESAFVFLIGHELGHHYLNHTKEEKNKYEDYMLKIDEASSKLVSFEQNSYKLNEYHADIISFRLFIQTFIYENKNLHFIHIYGTLLGFIASALLNSANILEDSPKHPSIHKRFKLVISLLKGRFNKDDIDFAIKIIYDICEELFQKKLFNSRWWTFDSTKSD